VNTCGYSSKLICCHSLSHRNLIDAANIAALAALSTFRRPECTVGGEDGQQVTMHDPVVCINLQCIVL
jgi:exosome complex RNA-binding protein Rrp42 (RNase PH superfamily)